jgi:hypothetical protein
MLVASRLDLRTRKGPHPRGRAIDELADRSRPSRSDVRARATDFDAGCYGV